MAKFCNDLSAVWMFWWSLGERNNLKTWWYRRDLALLRKTLTWPPRKRDSVTILYLEGLHTRSVAIGRYLHKKPGNSWSIALLYLSFTAFISQSYLKKQASPIGCNLLTFILPCQCFVCTWGSICKKYMDQRKTYFLSAIINMSQKTQCSCDVVVASSISKFVRNVIINSSYFIHSAFQNVSQ